MSIKFPIYAIALTTLFTLGYSAIATAEAYKSGADQVVVTGLNAKQKYDVKAVSVKGKQGKKSAMANTCGEILINGVKNVKSITVGTEAIDIATLPTKTHNRCNGKKNAAAKPSTMKSTSPAMAKPTTTTPTTTTPTTTTPTTTTPTTTK